MTISPIWWILLAIIALTLLLTLKWPRQRGRIYLSGWIETSISSDEDGKALTILIGPMFLGVGIDHMPDAAALFLGVHPHIRLWDSGIAAVLVLDVGRHEAWIQGSFVLPEHLVDG